MLDWLFADGAWVFGVPAGAGTALFLLKFLLMAVGVDHVVDTDVGFSDAGAAHVGDKLGGKDVSATRRWISFQGFIVFMMVGGWAGLMLLREARWHLWSAGAVALVAGVAGMWLFGQVFEQMYKLQTSGNIDLAKAVGVSGEVYVGVPHAGAGSGQVTLVVDQRQRIYNAEARGDELPRGSSVVVVGTRGDRTVVVDRVPDA